MSVEANSDMKSGFRPTFSVVIPTCDRGELLRRAVESVLFQTYAASEVLVINNGSQALATTFESAKVRVVEIMRHAGAAQARNVGAVLARGDYIAFLDDDDHWRPDYLEQVTNKLGEASADLVFASIEDGKTACRVDVVDFLTRNPGVVGSTTIVRRSAFMAVGGYDPRLEPSEDKALALEMLLNGFMVEPAPDAKAIMPPHGLPHLSRPENFVRGMAAFERKYGHLMTREHRLINEVRRASVRFRAKPRLRSGLRREVARWILRFYRLPQRLRGFLAL